MLLGEKKDLCLRQINARCYNQNKVLVALLADYKPGNFQKNIFEKGIPKHVLYFKLPFVSSSDFPIILDDTFEIL